MEGGQLPTTNFCTKDGKSPAAFFRKVVGQNDKKEERQACELCTTISFNRLTAFSRFSQLVIVRTDVLVLPVLPAKAFRNHT